MFRHSSVSLLRENPRSSGNAQIFVAARYDLISAGENWVTAVASSEALIALVMRLR